jgi:hypothetical protein
VKLKDLIPDSRNANKGSERGGQMIENSLRQYGAGRSILIDKNGRIIAGNKTHENAGAIGLSDDVIVVQSDGTKLVAVQRTDLDLTKDKAAKELAIADNRTSEVSLSWSVDVLKELDTEIDLKEFWTEAELDLLLNQDPETPFDGEGGGSGEANRTLAERFGVPPFSVLDARQGYWQDRKRAWLELGIQSELGRGDSAGSKLTMSETIQELKPSADQAAKNARANAEPGGSKMPAADYSKTKARGDGRGRSVGNGGGNAVKREPSARI